MSQIDTLCYHQKELGIHAKEDKGKSMMYSMQRLIKDEAMLSREFLLLHCLAFNPV